MKPPLFQYLDWTWVYIEGGRAVHQFGGEKVVWDDGLSDGSGGTQYVIYAETWWYTNGVNITAIKMME
jgi:hypothetical protein